MAYRHLDQLRTEWRERGPGIDRRLREFRALRRAGEEELFRELAFCLLAIQTSARRADDAVRALDASGLLWRGTERSVAAFLRSRVRFHNHKATYLVAARTRFLGGKSDLGECLRATPPTVARQHLVDTVSGFGLKEASHFLRNVGRGEDFAILDRHVLRNSRHHGVVRSIPSALTAKRYLSIEEDLRRFSRWVRIPMAGIDLLFWSRETGEVFR